MDNETLHTIQVLESMGEALSVGDPVKLKELSNQTIHSACGIQDPGSLTIAVLAYSLGKLLERRDGMKIRGWDDFVKKFNSYIPLAIKALKENKVEAYENYLLLARKSLSSISGNLRKDINDVLRKASINKASKIYEHGISLGKTADLLGVTQWELADYTGQMKVDESHTHTLNIKRRAQMALEFFS